MLKNEPLLRMFIIYGLMLFSVVGGLTCSVVGWLFFDSTSQMMQHPLWSVLVYVFMFLFMIALLVLFPIEIFYFRMKERGDKALQKITKGDVIGLPFGVTNPDAEVPKWIKTPILILMYILISIFILASLLGTIAYLLK